MIRRLGSANGLFINDVQRPFMNTLQTSISKTRQKATIKINLLTVMQVFGNATDFSLCSKTVRRIAHQHTVKTDKGSYKRILK